MAELTNAYWISSATAIVMLLLMVLLNLYILFKHTLEKKTWKKMEYQLILLRVSCDEFIGISGFTFLVLTVIDVFYNTVPYEVSFTFGIISYNLMEIRSFLAAAIAIERVLATTFPLKFYHYRNRVSNLLVLSFIVSTGISSDVVLFLFCGFRFELVPGCTNFNCATPICFQRYSSATRIIYSTANVIFSVILCYKLFWLSLKQSKVSVDIRKANWLSLTDGISTFSLELVPWLISYYGIIDTKPLGPVIGAFRSTGRVIEALVMLKLMKKKDVTVQPSRFSFTTRQH